MSASLVVFDLDGVIIDSRRANYEAFAAGIEAVGQSRPGEDEVVPLIGLPAKEMLRCLGCPVDRLDDIFEEVVKPHYLNNLHRLAQPVEGAEKVLSVLRNQGYRVAACTSGDRRTQEQALGQLGLLDFFEDMQTPDDSSYNKPQVEYLQELLERLDYQGPIIHVEDSKVGLRMGLECGATTVFADYGFGDPGELSPHHRISSLEQLLSLL